MALKDLLDKAAEVKDKAKKVAGEAVEHGAKKLGVEEQLEKATQATGELVKNVSQAVQTTANKAAEATGKAVERGAETLGIEERVDKATKAAVKTTQIVKAAKTTMGKTADKIWAKPENRLTPEEAPVTEPLPISEQSSLPDEADDISVETLDVAVTTPLSLEEPPPTTGTVSASEADDISVETLDVAVTTPLSLEKSPPTTGKLSSSVEEPPPTIDELSSLDGGPAPIEEIVDQPSITNIVPSGPSSLTEETGTSDVSNPSRDGVSGATAPPLDAGKSAHESTDTSAEVKPPKEKGFGYGYALTFPLHQKKWPARIWWVLLVGFLPIIDVILLRGWRVDIVRRMGRGEENFLPEMKDIGRFLASGITLWVMTFIYLIPQFILLGIFGKSYFEAIFDVLLWFYQTIFMGGAEVTLDALVLSIFAGFLSKKILPVAYYILSWPVYRAGMIRFAITGRASAFFNIPKNIALAIKHLHQFMLAFFFFYLTLVLIGGMIILLGATGIGVVLLPILTPTLFLVLHYWTTGAVYGRLARKLNP